MPARYASHPVDVSPLGKPLHFAFSQREAPNRFYKAAMTERLSSWSPTDLKARGIPSSELVNVYKRWGEGGYGLISTGNIMLAYDQLEAPGNPIIDLENPYHGQRFEAFRELATQAKKHGSLVIGQVSHPGRQTEERLQPDPVSASDVRLEKEIMGMRFAKPHAASKDEIQDFVRRWTHAAVYLHKAGYDGIQLHGAHGYLLAQFLSQTTNHRTDEYGGSLENRARLIVEIARSIRKELPASTGFMLGIKINSVEFQTGGFTAEEARALCRILEENEFDFVELSGGTYESLAFSHRRESTGKRESFFLEFASLITPVLSKTRSYVTGGLRTASGMVGALHTVDGVGLARPACQEFHLPRDILEGKVTGAIEPKIDQQDFGITSAAAGMQMKQVGKDEDPIDLSDEKNVEMFLKHQAEWGQKMQQDAAKMNLYGYVDLPKGDAFRE
ncbi:NADH:flavin oxidoreductase/NADH oxidase family protein [Aspergillus clavatus NRRL 1]|uniref:NADH oxidase n=1 Tax=Aspergillus clavatus (strain ATCC 1007 / CBS 513.65 / DSM 816 / NCTC 3887 / NRRL 1 / QM 1276 / 107) TaxID=344612 RepID=A1CPP0_ASPCL|nr:NADH oxidase [Aspergillus clavatus NRRL 1]EAW07611.1 NADH oxidase [Aspergillus clavatus NRRL 1]